MRKRSVISRTKHEINTVIKIHVTNITFLLQKENHDIWRTNHQIKKNKSSSWKLSSSLWGNSKSELWESFNRGPSNCRFCFIALIQKCSLLNTFVNAISSQRCWQLSSFLNIHFKNIKMQHEKLDFRQLKKISIFDKQKKATSYSKIRYFLEPVTT